MSRFEDIVFLCGPEAHTTFDVAGQAVMAAGKGIRCGECNTMLMGCAEWVRAMVDYLVYAACRDPHRSPCCC
jgi:hypothetical protein